MLPPGLHVKPASRRHHEKHANEPLRRRFWQSEGAGARTTRMNEQLSGSGMRYVTESTECDFTCMRKTTLVSIAAVPYPMICGLRPIKLETWKRDIE